MSDNEVAETKAAEASEAPKKAADNTTSASPVKRGPGRPRKVKTEAAEAPAEAKPKRGPGRPRKTPVVSEAAESASTPAPAKAAKAAAQSASEAPAEEKPKRRPGRPRKNPLPVDAEGSSKGAPVRALKPRRGGSCRR